MKTEFIILFQGRAGGSYCQRALASHPLIHCDGEILSSMTDPTAQREKVERLFSMDSQWVGFKTKLRDLADPQAFALFIEQRGCRTLFISRKNSIKAAISVINALRLYEQHGVWNLTMEQQKMPPLVITKEQLDYRLARREQLNEVLLSYYDQLKTTKKLFYYEDLLADESHFLSRILEFLGAEQRPLNGALLKNSDNDLRKLIVNFDQLRAHYVGTRYQAMFDET